MLTIEPRLPAPLPFRAKVVMAHVDCGKEAVELFEAFCIRDLDDCNHITNRRIIQLRGELGIPLPVA